MDKKLMRILILLAYSIPYGYLAMNGDATSGTMIFYGLMIMGFSLLYKVIVKTREISLLIIGNILSFITSYFFTLRNLSSKEWSSYFKPFTPLGLLVLISIISFIIQILLAYQSRKNEGQGT